ncbi:MAG TPA: ISAzo13 family transposase, partial [Calditrichaeota bacterium]|nr:ISAzo13 family transposase [Calditrichota bacterium]
MALIEEIMEPETAGDPMGKWLNWTRKSTYKLCEELKRQNINISPNTSGKILKHLNYSLKSNRKSISTTTHPDRNPQFEFIGTTVKQFEDSGEV